MSRYDVDKFEPPPDPDFICCICHCVLDTPVESRCRHVFCKVCIETWLKDHRNCPTCRRRLVARGLKPVIPILQNMINRLAMKCDFKDNGCMEKITLETYEKHIQSCGFKTVRCRFSRCGKSLLKMDLEEHECRTCDYREVKCTNRCMLMIPLCLYESHDCFEEMQKFATDMSNLAESLKDKVQEMKGCLDSLMNQMSNISQQLEEARLYNPSLSSMSDLSSVNTDTDSDSNSSLDMLMNETDSDDDGDDNVSQHSSDVEILEVESDQQSSINIHRHRRRVHLPEEEQEEIENDGRTSISVRTRDIDQNSSEQHVSVRNKSAREYGRSRSNSVAISVARYSDDHLEDHNTDVENENTDTSYNYHSGDSLHSNVDVRNNGHIDSSLNANRVSHTITGTNIHSSPHIIIDDLFDSTADVDIVSSTTHNSVGVMSYSRQENDHQSSRSTDIGEYVRLHSNNSCGTRPMPWSDSSHFFHSSLTLNENYQCCSSSPTITNNYSNGKKSSDENKNSIQDNSANHSGGKWTVGKSSTDNVGFQTHSDNNSSNIDKNVEGRNDNILESSISNSKKRKVNEVSCDVAGSDSIIASNTPPKRSRHTFGNLNEKNSNKIEKDNKAHEDCKTPGGPSDVLHGSKSRVSVITTGKSDISCASMSSRGDQKTSGNSPQQFPKNGNSPASKGDYSVEKRNSHALLSSDDENVLNLLSTTDTVAISDEESDDDPDWMELIQEASNEDNDDDDFMSDENFDTDSSYEVLIPRTTAQLLNEYESDDSDDSWTP